MVYVEEQKKKNKFYLSVCIKICMETKIKIVRESFFSTILLVECANRACLNKLICMDVLRSKHLIYTNVSLNAISTDIDTGTQKGS